MTSCLAADDSNRRFWSPLLASALFGAVMVAPGGVAHADDATAEALFQSGKTLMEQKKYADACPKLEASYKLDPAIGTKLNIADCHEKEGKLAQAWADWGEARDQAKRENDKPRMDLAVRRQKELDAKVPKLTVNVTGPADGLAVFRDELQLDSAMLGVPLPVDPGTHVITLRRGNSVLRDKKVDVVEKSTGEVTIDATGIPAATSVGQNGASGGTMVPGQPAVVMVRKSRGLMAGGIVLASLGGMTAFGGLIFAAVGSGSGIGVAPGAVVFLMGAGMTTGGIVMAVKGAKKVPKPATALEIPPPSVFVGPGSVMIRGQF